MYFKCLIIEDEPLAVEILTDYIRQVPFLKLVDTCNNAIIASTILRQKQVDLIFLDIHLPQLNGLEFLETLVSPPKVILTTAYHQYALKSYDYNVLDYLVKPIDFGRFLIGVNKLIGSNSVGMPYDSQEEGDLFVNIRKKKVRIRFSEITFIESQREYVNIHLPNKVLTTKLTLSTLLRRLPESDFIQVHRSFVVAKSAIESYNSFSVEVAGKSLPIGRNYKANWTKFLNT